MKLALGTAQFGMPYGISNMVGKTKLAEVERILTVAAENKVELLDTAPAYGDAEQVLGKILSDGQHDFKVVSKLCTFDVEESLYQSLNNLQQSTIYALLLHKPAMLATVQTEKLLEDLNKLKVLGLVQKIGVSVYTSEDIDQMLEIFKPDLVQLPLNIYNQKLLNSGHIAKLHQLGVELHIRSIFLQGLLLMEEENIPSYFTSVLEHTRNYFHNINEKKLSKLEAALLFIKQRHSISYGIVGVNSCQQLLEILRAYHMELEAMDFAKFAVDEEAIINPSCWN